MKLVKIRVTNFRSIEDSGDFGLDQVLCLVGKNEAGKTALLQALAGLNPHPSTPIAFNVERDYPRRFLPEYAERHPKEQATVVRTEWELSDDERSAISEEFGLDALSGPIVLLRRYGDSVPIWEIPVAQDKVIKYLLDAEKLSVTERKPLASAKTSQELKKSLASLQDPTERQASLFKRLSNLPQGHVTGAIKSILEAYLPYFMYFSHYDRMAGQIRLDTMTSRIKGELTPPLEAGERVFLDFLEYAGTSIGEITRANTYENLNARCEGASNHITQQLLEYWTQNPNLEVEVRVTKAEPGDPEPFNTGVIARARVKNNLHKVTVPFAERSAGFIWFFSFLVKFAQVKKSGDELILLLDEPGLTLHGKAQADLLRYFFERLAPDHQVIFSTHSPFMVPAERLPDVRIVEDVVTSPRPGSWTSAGTKVRSDALAVDRDTLFPLQGALGYEVTQTLFIGRDTLLVEGPGDILFLHAWSAALARRGRSRLDPRWTVCPAGGIDKIQPFVSLFSGAKLNLAVLTDFSKSDKRKLDSLTQNRILEGERLLTFATLLGQEEADIEDVFSPTLYLDIVNSSFGLTGKNRITVQKLAEHGGGSPRLLKQVEACFKLLPPSYPEFDHFIPADWIFRHPEMLDAEDEPPATTLKRAEFVITSLNRLLPS